MRAFLPCIFGENGRGMICKIIAFSKLSVIHSSVQPDNGWLSEWLNFECPVFFIPDFYLCIFAPQLEPTFLFHSLAVSLLLDQELFHVETAICLYAYVVPGTGEATAYLPVTSYSSINDLSCS